MWYFRVILVLMLVLDVAWWWYADTLLRSFRRARLWRGMVAAFVLVQVVLLCWNVTAHWFGPGFDQLTPKSLIAAVYLWHLVALPILLLLWIAAGVVTMPWRLARWLRRERVEDPRHHVTASETLAAAADLALEPETCVQSPSRRQFIGAAFAAAPPLLTAGTVCFSSLTLDRFRVRDMTVAAPGLPRDLDGMTIAHVTDIHVGRFTDGRQLRRIVEATNQLRADFVLMTGDLINSSLSDLPAALDAVKKMDARFGVYLCEGNHDLFDGRVEFEQAVTSAGVPLLVDETATVRGRNAHPVQLLGLRWGAPGVARRSPGGDESLAITVPPLLSRREPGAFPILLAHHPHAFDFAAQAGIPLTLSGHTHGGQLMLTRNIGFGRVYRYWSGLYTQGASSLVVSNGVGNWFPLRVNAPAEIVHILLRRA
jgi:predicted MPP superfamily phosphohydrolase